MQARNMLFKVDYDNMDPSDKLDYLRVQINESENMLRHKTD